MQKYFDWDSAINRHMVAKRGVSFEDVVFYIERGGLRDILCFRNTARDPQQTVLAVEIEAYVYLVPCIETDNAYLLQSITPSRKATQQYTGVRV